MKENITSCTSISKLNHNMLNLNISGQHFKIFSISWKQETIHNVKAHYQEKSTMTHFVVCQFYHQHTDSEAFADNILYLSHLAQKIRLDILFKLSPQETIWMKCQVLFFIKIMYVVACLFTWECLKLQKQNYDHKMWQINFQLSARHFLDFRDLTFKLPITKIVVCFVICLWF